jgi:hypothetical protein
VLILYGTEVSFAFGFSGNDIKRSQHVTKYNVLCVFVCVLNILSFHKKSVGKIFWNVAGCIKPIRLRYIEDCFDGKSVRVSGWGRNSDS